MIGRITEISGQGSHSVLFVEVERIILDESAGSLVYFQRQFHALGTP